MRDSPIEIIAYNPAWPRWFERERALLAVVLAPWSAGGIEHVGSTAVPGLGAKPIVDIMAGVADLGQARDAVESLTALGYRYWADDPKPWRHWLLKPHPARRTHHLHLVEPSHPEWRARLAFRDALRARPELAAEYEALKRRLAVRHRTDREAYTEAKGAFVRAVVAKSGAASGR